MPVGAECSSSEKREEGNVNCCAPSVCSKPQVSSPAIDLLSMGDSFSSPGLWNVSTNLGLHGHEIAAISKSILGGSQQLDAFWNSYLDALPGGESLARTGPEILPPNLSHFPVDSAFIERAARLSSYTAAAQSLSPSSNGGSPDTKEKKGICLPDVKAGEFEFNGSSHANAGEEYSSKNLGARKRKTPNEDLAISSEKKKATIKNANGKESKDVKETSKDKEYIHVRARHGQATNSHSLAERVRREKISQRMKFLQEIVPGCSKVTGKAVMLDEIINYVQSLQQQVEFLSMKLATVHPRLGSNIEALLSRDLLQCHGATSSAIGFSADLVNPQLHLSQQGFLQSGLCENYEPPNAFGRGLNSQHILFKSPVCQATDAWDAADAQDIMKMATFSNQEFIDKAQDKLHL